MHIIFFESKILQRIKYFFRKPPKSSISSRLESTKAMTLLRAPSIYFNKSLTKLKITFYKTAQAHFLRAKFDNVLSSVFVNHLDKKLTLV